MEIQYLEGWFLYWNLVQSTVLGICWFIQIYFSEKSINVRITNKSKSNACNTNRKNRLKWKIPLSATCIAIVGETSLYHSGSTSDDILSQQSILTTKTMMMQRISCTVWCRHKNFMIKQFLDPEACHHLIITTLKHVMIYSRAGLRPILSISLYVHGESC